MASIVKSLRAISDPTRLRLLLVLLEEELTVAELQEILGMGQIADFGEPGLVEAGRNCR